LDPRIGPNAYVSPGAAFAGGTLARDLVLMADLARQTRIELPLIGAAKGSNDAHRRWAQRRLEQILGPLTGRTGAGRGLTYKPGTDTLRRSSAVELCEWLHARGAAVRVHDPIVGTLPPELAAAVQRVETPLEAVDGASALVLGTPWPEYRQVLPDAV